MGRYDFLTLDFLADGIKDADESEIMFDKDKMFKEKLRDLIPFVQSVTDKTLVTILNASGKKNCQDEKYLSAILSFTLISKCFLNKQNISPDNIKMIRKVVSEIGDLCQASMKHPNPHMFLPLSVAAAAVMEIIMDLKSMKEPDFLIRAEAIAWCYRVLGIYFQSVPGGDIQSAYIFQQGIQFTEKEVPKASDFSVFGLLKLSMGDTLAAAGNYTDAVNYYTEGIPLIKAATDWSSWSKEPNSNQAVTYYENKLTAAKLKRKGKFRYL